MVYVWFALSIVAFVIFLFNPANSVVLVVGLLLSILSHLESIEEKVEKRNK